MTLPHPRREREAVCTECYLQEEYKVKSEKATQWLRENLPTMEEFLPQYYQIAKSPIRKPEALIGNCHAAAHVLVQVLKAKNITARIKRGHWLGPDVRPERASFPAQQHSWVQVDLPSSLEIDIIFYADPTQHVFTGGPLEIAITNEDDRRYDPGSYRLKMMVMGKRELPPREKDQQQKSRLDTKEQAILSRVFGERDWKYWTRDEQHVIANTNPNMLRGRARQIFSAIVHCGNRALIPIDTRLEILGE